MSQSLRFFTLQAGRSSISRHSIGGLKPSYQGLRLCCAEEGRYTCMSVVGIGSLIYVAYS